LSCAYCAASATKANKRNLLVINKAIIHNILAACRPYGINKIILSGGEPLFINNIVEVVKELTDNMILVSLSTNGTLLSPALLSQLKAAGLQKIIIGLHWENIKHSIPRVKLFNFMRSVVGYLKQYRINHEYSLVLVPTIDRAIKQIVKLAMISKPSTINCIEPQFCGRLNSDLMLSIDDHDKMLSGADVLTKQLSIDSSAKCILVRPNCSGDCPAGKNIYSIVNGQLLDTCLWKQYTSIGRYISKNAETLLTS
jgi:molybdenum cofactor biosynthesis enzyme MoaA